VLGWYGKAARGKKKGAWGGGGLPCHSDGEAKGGLKHQIECEGAHPADSGAIYAVEAQVSWQGLCLPSDKQGGGLSLQITALV